MIMVKYLKEITSSRSSVKDFYQRFCLGNERNNIFHQANQASVCETISQYESML